ncbi:sigma-54 interaction domain-containing protein [Xanthobacter flavus]|uniref:sigma-54 interaction domain-containing protein n=1 Tax=Xanthobacter flavus TaxID=281 RepID=UPI003726E066
MWEASIQSAAQPFEGVVARDADGRILFACGLGADARIKALAANKAWVDELRIRRIQPLILDKRRYSVLLAAAPDCELLLLSKAPGDAVMEFLGSVEFAFDILNHMLTDPFEALTVVDADARIVYISPIHEKFFGISHGEANGRPVRDVIENTRLDKVVMTGKAEIGSTQKMQGAQRIVSRVAIRRGDRVVGAMGRVMFKGPQQLDELSRRVNALESKVAFYQRETASLRRRSYGLDDLIGQSPAIRRLKADVIKVAPLELPVLIHGESGTGKELVAHSLHRLSLRRDARMVMVNSAALPAALVESELFGYEAGAFTGADRKGRKGKFEQASDSSIFLDEIGDMPVDLQVKLLRVLQDRVIEPIGSEKSIEVDFRLITATNRDLHQLVKEEKFRLDLFYRISAITIEVPPLRQRIEDIPLLIEHFLKEFAERHGRRPAGIDDEAVNYLMEQAWPGNVRQLNHEIERALVFTDDGRLTLNVFLEYSGLRADLSPAPMARPDPDEGGTLLLKDAVERMEVRMVQDALKRHNGNKKRVAEELGISRSYIYKLLGLQEA